jgi:hypothetical protein
VTAQAQAQLARVYGLIDPARLYSGQRGDIGKSDLRQRDLLAEAPETLEVRLNDANQAPVISACWRCSLLQGICDRAGQATIDGEEVAIVGNEVAIA